MKLVCDCGQEMAFVTTDENGVENESTPEEGQFASTDANKFSLVLGYEVLYIICKAEECQKAIGVVT